MFLKPNIVLESINILNSVHPFFGITYLTCKKNDLPINKEIAISIDNCNKDFLNKYHKLCPDTSFYFQPYSSNSGEKRWVNERYPSTGLQAINTQTFRDAFLHEAGARTWGWKADYISVLSKWLTKNNGKLPAFAIAIWIYRDHSFEAEANGYTVIEQFFTDFNISESERKILFDDSNPFDESLFSTEQVTWDILKDKLPPPPELVDVIHMKARDDSQISGDLSSQEKDYILRKVDFLKKNYNIILSGAPGTGKTFLAKQIAQHMGAVTKLVQFHPSMDYSDFVEGLKPVKTDNANGANSINFELVAGIFKQFCLDALLDSTIEDNFEAVYSAFRDEYEEKELVLKTPKYRKEFEVEFASTSSCVAIPKTQSRTRMTITKDLLKNYMRTGNVSYWKPYITAIGNFIREKYKYSMKKSLQKKRDYVLIIDEINRGDISKIFGEVFYAVEPGYRGPNGRINTQFERLLPESDPFKNGFYVPENVYIIGTMNDIDRGIESMDFAIRRRFSWISIDPQDRISMWDTGNGLPEKVRKEAAERMSALNAVISEIDGLGRAFHIGPAYFLKLHSLGYSFDQLWLYHLEPLLSEYLRGFPSADKSLEEMSNAYNLVQSDTTKE